MKNKFIVILVFSIYPFSSFGKSKAEDKFYVDIDESICIPLQEKNEKIGAISEKMYDNGPQFSTKEKALESLALLFKEPSFNEEALKIFKQVHEENKLPEKEKLLADLKKLNYECGLFQKYYLFWAFSLDYKRIGFNQAEQNLFKEKFNYFMSSGLSQPTTLMSILLRMHTLKFFTEVGLIGTNNDKQKVKALLIEMEKEVDKFKKDKKSKNVDRLSIDIFKREIAFNKKYVPLVRKIFESIKN